MNMPLFPSDRDVYTVSRLNREARALLERGLGVLWIEGELTNFSQPSSGHWYFTLKDRDAQLRCAMFRQRNFSLKFTPSAGAHVLARGRISLYEPRGDYQLIVDHMEEAGLGALNREFERLKAKLSAEGLFAAGRKRPLPRFPERIGVITSPSGAAIRDILHVLRRRFAPAAVRIYPTSVQGAAAAPEILDALAIAAARNECDVLIVARGGGSIEDLWAFNDEGVARAICASPIPVVSGVGHEIDFTIADFVADARAPTPTGAAEMVVPEGKACLEALARVAERLSYAIRRELHAIGALFDATQRRLALAHPGARLTQQEQRLDDVEQRLLSAVRGNVAHISHRLAELWADLLHCAPDEAVNEFRLKHEALTTRLRHAVEELLSTADHRLAMAGRTLDTVSPLATLGRGFAIVTRKKDGTLVMDAETLQIGEDVEARLAKGKLEAKVTRKNVISK
jgi:exodeoxyribonuclease VII large subunit